MNRLFILSFCLVLFSLSSASQCPVKHPVVLIPGIYGSVLEGFSSGIPEDIELPDFCPRNFSQRRLWISVPELLPGEWKCFKNYFELVYNEASQVWNDLTGMHIDPIQFGDVAGVEYLDPASIWSSFTGYYHKVIDGLEKVGYKSNFDLVAASYDWRKIPDATWNKKFKLLVENITNTFGKKAVLVSHSMGAPWTQYFLVHQSSAWRQKYIHRHITIAPAWMGAPKVVDVMFDGLRTGLPLDGKLFAPLARNVASTWGLLPRPVAWPADSILAQSPSKNWTFAEVDQLLEAAGASSSYQKKKGAAYVETVLRDYDDVPNIPVSCIVGHGIATTESLWFKDDIKKTGPNEDWQKPEKITCDGDGTVPLRSTLYACNKWKNLGADVKTTKFEKVSHVGLIKDKGVVNQVVELSCEAL